MSLRSSGAHEALYFLPVQDLQGIGVEAVAKVVGGAVPAVDPGSITAGLEVLICTFSEYPTVSCLRG